MHEKVILIIGEVFVDTHLDIFYEEAPLVRLGGIFHSARAFSSINTKYALAYYAPSYLEENINYYSCILKAERCHKLGTILKAPNVMLIKDSKEIGYQGYSNILKDQAEYKEENDLLKIINDIKPSDILIYPGRYNTQKVIQSLNNFDGNIHIDFHYDSNKDILNTFKRSLSTVILSTSSSLFKEQCQESLNGIIDYFSNHNVEKILVKENRGGSYCYSIPNKKLYESPAYFVPTMHSVGIGDAYNSFFISDYLHEKVDITMRFSSICAAKYAETLCFEKFKENIQLLLSDIKNIIKLKGVRLSWEERSQKNIYLAAPDFPEIDTFLLDRLADCLTYHNFKPRLPIRENGLAHPSMSFDQEINIYQKDIELINSCDLLIAVLLFNDPGTLVELGMFKQIGKPTIIYDPYGYCKNLFVKHTPDFLCNTISEVIDAVYECLKRMSFYA